MSQWVDKFRAHAVHDVLSQLSSQIESAREIADDDSDALAHLLRLSRSIDLTTSRLSECDPEVAPFAPLVGLQQRAQQILDQLNSYVSNENAGHLTNANNEVDQFIIILNTNYPPGVSLGSSDIVDILTEARAELERFASASEDHLTRLTQECEELSTKSDETIQELGAQRTRLDEAINNFQQQFAQAEEARREQAQQALEEQAVAFSEFERTEAESLAELRAQISSTAEELISELNAHREQAQKTLHAIGNTGMVSGYQTDANESRDASRNWKRFTVGSMLGLIGFAVFAFLLTMETGEFDFGRFGARVFVAATFGIVAAYCARQADRLDERERKSRKMELELASIDPYLANLPEEIQRKVKETLAARFFGREEEPKPTKGKTTTGTAKDATDLIKAVGDLIKAKDGA